MPQSVVKRWSDSNFGVDSPAVVLPGQMLLSTGELEQSLVSFKNALVTHSDCVPALLGMVRLALRLPVSIPCHVSSQKSSLTGDKV